MPISQLWAVSWTCYIRYDGLPALLFIINGSTMFRGPLASDQWNVRMCVNLAPLPWTLLPQLVLMSESSTKKLQFKWGWMRFHVIVRAWFFAQMLGFISPINIFAQSCKRIQFGMLGIANELIYSNNYNNWWKIWLKNKSWVKTYDESISSIHWKPTEKWSA